MSESRLAIFDRVDLLDKPFICTFDTLIFSSYDCPWATRVTASPQWILFSVTRDVITYRTEKSEMFWFLLFVFRLTLTTAKRWDAIFPLVSRRINSNEIANDEVGYFRLTVRYIFCLYGNLLLCPIIYLYSFNHFKEKYINLLSVAPSSINFEC